jgi:glutamine cyclotransferase
LAGLAIPCFLVSLLCLNCLDGLVGKAQAGTGAGRFSFVIVNRFPHDPMAFTQGLVWDNGTVFEGTGKYGRSSLRRVDLVTGRVEQQRDYPKRIFAEGITVLGNTIYQLTWKNNRVFQYDKHDFSLLKSWPFPRQGWGLTHNGRELIVSDGSATLYFLDPATLGEQRRISVHDGSRQISQLNELEYIKGAVYANIWHSNWIAIIDPADGAVSGWLDLNPLPGRLETDKPVNVLNGIMYDPAADRLFVTGKLWPTLFEIRVVPPGQ